MNPAGTAAAAEATCPRCGARFDCGAAGPDPCPCSTLALPPALLQRLAAQFHGCLCGPCLRELAAAEEAAAAR